MYRCIFRLNLKGIAEHIDKRVILIPACVRLSGYRDRAKIGIDAFLQRYFCRIGYNSPILLRLRSRQPVNDIRTGVACPGKGHRSVLTQIRGFRSQRQPRPVCCPLICPYNRFIRTSAIVRGLAVNRCRQPDGSLHLCRLLCQLPLVQLRCLCLACCLLSLDLVRSCLPGLCLTDGRLSGFRLT